MVYPIFSIILTEPFLRQSPYSSDLFLSLYFVRTAYPFEKQLANRLKTLVIDAAGRYFTNFLKCHDERVNKGLHYYTLVVNEQVLGNVV